VNDYIPYLIFGLVDGSIYGLAAMGLILTYKTSGVFNFGHGAIAAISAYVFYELKDRQGMPWGLAAVITVVGVGIVAGLAMELLGRRLAGVAISQRIVATVGILILLTAVATLIYGPQSRTLEPFLPDDVAFTISGVNVTADQLIVFFFGVGSAAALFIFFRLSELGTAMRAVVDDPELLDMTGQNPARVRRAAWVIGTTFASACGILLALRISVDPLLISLLVITAFGAATFGAFRSLPLTFVGGLIVGVLQNVTAKLIVPHPALNGLDINIPFIVLFLGLLLLPRGRLVEAGRTIKSKPRQRSTLDPRARAGGVAVMAGLILAAPFFAGTKMPLYVQAVPFALLFLSLGLLVRVSMQVSLCQVGFAAVGGAAGGHMLQNGVPWGLAILLGGLAAVPVGLLVAIPAIRLSGLYLGLATLGFGVFLSNFCYGKAPFFGNGTLAAPRPDLLGMDSDRGYYYLMVAILGVAIALVLVIERCRLGRLLRGMAESPLALTTHGGSINVTKGIIFAVSAFMAGIAGALTGPVNGLINGDAFIYFYSLVILAVYAICGTNVVVAALLATVLYKIVPGYVSDPDFALYLQVAFGAAAILAAIGSQGGGITSRLRLAAQRASGPRRSPATARLVRQGVPTFAARREPVLSMSASRESS
jgi:branched-subunit amino acid ABC-type transport system permease component